MLRFSPSSRGGLAVAALVAALPVLAGCAVSRVPFEASRAGRGSALPAAAEDADLPAVLPSVEPVLRRAGERREYEVFDLELPSAGDSRQPGNRVRARYFRHRGRGRRPVVVILPIWGRSGYPPRATTKHLLARGRYHLLRISGEESVIHWPGLRDAATPGEFLAATQASADSLAATVLDVRRLIHWLARQPEAAPGEIALVGYSISAILGARILGEEPRVQRGVLVMGGGHLDQVFERCEKRAGRVRTELLERFGWSAERFRGEITDLLAPLDPVATAPRVDPAQVLYIDARRDNCIPESAREDLWRALGRPERIQIDATHRPAFLTMTFLQGHWLTHQIVEFLERPWARRGGIEQRVSAGGASRAQGEQPE